MEKSESIKNIAIALCQFQSAVENIKKTEENPFFKSKYASLADILSVIRQPLADNGLSFVQFPKSHCQLETMLMHISGEWISEGYEMKPTKDDPQGAGSVITYQRRYALGAILGLNIDEDDDGNKGSQKVEPKKEVKTEPKKEEAEVKKPQLVPGTEQWTKAVAYLKGSGTMTGILKKYNVNTKDQETLVNATL